MRPVLKLMEHWCVKFLLEHFPVHLWHLWQTDTATALVQNLLNATLNFTDLSSRKARGNSTCLHKRCIQVICRTKIQPWSKHSLSSRVKDRWLSTYLKIKHGSCQLNINSKMHLSPGMVDSVTLEWTMESHGHLSHSVWSWIFNYWSDEALLNVSSEGILEEVTEPSATLLLRGCTEAMSQEGDKIISLWLQMQQ